MLSTFFEFQAVMKPSHVQAGRRTLTPPTACTSTQMLTKRASCAGLISDIASDFPSYSHCSSLSARGSLQFACGLLNSDEQGCCAGMMISRDKRRCRRAEAAAEASQVSWLCIIVAQQGWKGAMRVISWPRRPRRRGIAAHLRTFPGSRLRHPPAPDRTV